MDYINETQWLFMMFARGMDVQNSYIEFVLIGVWQIQDERQLSHQKYGKVYGKIIYYI